MAGMTTMMTVRMAAVEVVFNQKSSDGRAPLEAVLIDPKEDSNTQMLSST